MEDREASTQMSGALEETFAKTTLGGASSKETSVQKILGVT